MTGASPMKLLWAAGEPALEIALQLRISINGYI